MPIKHERLGVAVICGYLGYLMEATYEIAELHIDNSPGTGRMSLW